MGKSSLKLLYASGSSNDGDAALLNACLQEPSLTVLEKVSTGEEVLSNIKKGKADILLMDTSVKGLDALSVLSEFELQGVVKPVLFIISAFVDQTVLSVFENHGVMYCFAKPIYPEYVVRQIVRLSQASLRKSAGRQPQYEIRTREELIRNEITRQIRAVGIPAHLKGYHYLRSAIFLVARAPETDRVPVTKVVYPHVAAEFNTKPTLVERAIRNAIEVSWTRGNAEILDQFFGYTIDDKKGKPTNSEFISMIADRVRMAFRF